MFCNKKEQGDLIGFEGEWQIIWISFLSKDAFWNPVKNTLQEIKYRQSRLFFLLKKIYAKLQCWLWNELYWNQ